MNPGVDDAAPLVVAVDDAAYAERQLAWLLMLAAGLRRPLSLVVVESAAARGAAALPLSQVLPHAGAAWQPLRRDELELGFRAQAARLQAALERARRQQAVPPLAATTARLRVLRGSLPECCEALWAETNLLVLAAAPLAGALPMAALRHSRPPRVALAPDADGDGARERAAAVAARLAQALAGAPTAAGATAPDLLVMARRAVDAALLRRGPLLLVG